MSLDDDDDLDSTDPITTLVKHLRAGEAPPIAWVVEWLDDGRFPRAWAKTTDLTAVRFILGSPYAGAIGPGAPKTTLGRFVSILLGEEMFLQVVAGSMTGIAVRVIGSSRIGISRLASWILATSNFAASISQRERVKIAERLREQVEPPTLPELLRRLKIGAYAAAEGQ